MPPIVLWERHNDTDETKFLVIDGNHRISILQELVKKEGPQSRFRFVNAVVLHPQTPLEALEKICQGIYRRCLLFIL